jgi:ATP-dependent exoDNAse (exonuclease V) beta subunit
MQTPSFSIYDASAGSGKTYTLVKEYLKIILKAEIPDAYRNILAITFTNKAVFEMKSRIINNLSDFASDNPSASSIDLMNLIGVEIGLGLNHLKSKSKQVIKHLIHNYAAFDIMTIDKFTYRIIRSFAFDLNIPMTFELTVDNQNLLDEAVDSLLAQTGTDDVLTQLMLNFTLEKADDNKSWDITRDILATSKLLFIENSKNEINALSSITIADFLKSKSYLQKKVKEIENINIEKAQQILTLIDNNNIDKASFSGQYFPKHLNSIVEKRLKSSSTKYHLFEDIKINKTAKDKAIIESIIPEMLEILEIIYSNINKQNLYKACLQNLTPLSLIQSVNQELDQIKKTQNLLMLSEFNQIINDQIKDQPVPFIYERLGEKYRHYFIDEFQDTSEMQWQNLVPLIENALSGQDDTGNRGTLMLVGDPKQSIYRWRGGKAEQFIELAKNKGAMPNFDKSLFYLETNYRSYSEVIEFNNMFFKHIATYLDHQDYNDLYQNKSSQKTNNKTGGYISLNFIPKTLDEDTTSDDIYINETFSTIQKCINEQGFNYKDIAILVRKKENGTQIANFLTQHGIPILSSESLLIKNATEVHFIIHFLKYISNNKDEESKAKLLYYLAEFKLKISPHQFIIEGIEIQSNQDFSDWLQSFEINIDVHNLITKSLFEITETLISECIQQNNLDSNAYVQYFQDIVLERDYSKQGGIKEFLDFWETNSDKYSIPSPEGIDAIQILTIHKSKGLEFPVVIFPFADSSLSHQPKDKLWLELKDDEIPLTKILVNHTNEVAEYRNDTKELLNQKNQEILLDNINVLYVALTRAEQQLHIISKMNIDKNGTASQSQISKFFIEYLMNQNLFNINKHFYEFGQPVKRPIAEKLSKPLKKIKILPERFDFKNIKIAQREALLWNTKQQEAINIGNTIHLILSKICSKSDIEPAINTAIQDGILNTFQISKIKKQIDELVNHPKLKNFFNPNYKILNEQPIILKDEGVLIPDKMVITDANEVLLLDFKTGQPEAKHHEQLIKYQNAIQTMKYKVKVKLLVYITDEIKIEQIA